MKRKLFEKKEVEVDFFEELDFLELPPIVSEFVERNGLISYQHPSFVTLENSLTNIFQFNKYGVSNPCRE